MHVNGSSDERFGLDMQSDSILVTVGIDRALGGGIILGMSLGYQDASSESFADAWLTDASTIYGWKADIATQHFCELQIGLGKNRGAAMLQATYARWCKDRRLQVGSRFSLVCLPLRCPHLSARQ